MLARLSFSLLVAGLYIRSNPGFGIVDNYVPLHHGAIPSSVYIQVRPVILFFHCCHSGGFLLFAV